MEPIIIKYLLGVLANEAQSAVINKIKAFLSSPEGDGQTEKALVAMKAAFALFFQTYGEYFGPREESFLSWEFNINLMLDRIRLGKGVLKPADFLRVGEGQYPEVTDKELYFLIDSYEAELKRNRTLDDLLKMGEHLQQGKRIEETLNNIAGKMQSLPGSAGNGVPQLLTELPMKQPVFMGRERELKEMAEKLHECRHVLLVNGLGGIGKTEICKEFFFTHYGNYKHAAWLDYKGSMADTAAQHFSFDRHNYFGLVPEDTPEQVLEKFISFFRHRGGEAEALLMVDNIDNPKDPDLKRLLKLPCTVMVNSRDRLKGFFPYDLGFLEDSGCRELFYSHYRGEKDDENLGGIIKLCHGHTLTVDLLARTAQNAAMSIKDFLQVIEEKGFNLNGVIRDKVETFWHDTEAKKLFFEHLLTIFALSGAESEGQLNLLTNLAVLPVQFIPIKDIKEWLELESNAEIDQLVSQGWLRQQGFSVIMHHVIQEVTRFRPETQPNTERCRKLIDSLTNKLYFESGDNPLSKRPYMPFAHSVLSHINETDQDIASLANNLSSIYLELGQLENSLEFQLKALKIREEILDPNHPERAQSYNNLSLRYREMGQLEKALKFQLKAIGIMERIDSKHPNLAKAYNNLSMIYKILGQLEKALEFQLKALKISEKIFEPSHPDLATFYNNLSRIYQALGQLEKALEFQLKDVKISEEILEPSHPDLACSYHNLSQIYEELGQLEKALPLAEKTVNIMRELFPNGHYNLDLAVRNLERMRKKENNKRK